MTRTATIAPLTVSHQSAKDVAPVLSVSEGGLLSQLFGAVGDDDDGALPPMNPGAAKAAKRMAKD